jgi:hypothetical protein
MLRLRRNVQSPTFVSDEFSNGSHGLQMTACESSRSHVQQSCSGSNRAGAWNDPEPSSEAFAKIGRMLNSDQICGGGPIWRVKQQLTGEQERAAPNPFTF